MTIDEFIAKMDVVIEEHPLEAEKQLRKGANRMKKMLVEASPDSGKADAKQKIKKSWKVEMRGTKAGDIEADIYSKSPHFHLVERGYQMVDAHGTHKGFKQGTFFKEKTVKREGPHIQDEMVEKLAKRIGEKLV